MICWLCDPFSSRHPRPLSILFLTIKHITSAKRKHTSTLRSTICLHWRIHSISLFLSPLGTRMSLPSVGISFWAWADMLVKITHPLTDVRDLRTSGNGCYHSPLFRQPRDQNETEDLGTRMQISLLPGRGKSGFKIIPYFDNAGNSFGKDKRCDQASKFIALLEKSLGNPDTKRLVFTIKRAVIRRYNSWLDSSSKPGERWNEVSVSLAFEFAFQCTWDFIWAKRVLYSEWTGAGTRVPASNETPAA